MPRAKKHKFSIRVEQTTDNEIDGEVLLNEFSNDTAIHAIKVKVFTKHITAAIDKATDELTSMAIEASGGGGQSSRRKK